ncbi:MAG: molybdenum cofactor guanylyltransferase MobA [Sedimenticola sp.]|nr:MAG: molybdenum cofactor guanylyltransferase MobA [Sedimenticola sp.]
MLENRLPTRQTKITGVVLAGGMAQRMGGTDEGLIQLIDRPMIDYVIASLTPQVDTIIINANRNLQQYRHYGYPVVADTIGDFPGPLAGIATALSTAETDLVLTVPCDGPWLPSDLTQRLLDQFTSQNADVCVAHDGNRMQPVFGLFHKRILPDIEDYLSAGERKLQLWLKRVRLATADFSDHPEAFINVNTPEEKERVERILSGSTSTQ